MKLIQVILLVVLTIIPTFGRLASDQIGHCIVENVEDVFHIKFVCYVSVYDKHILTKENYALCHSPGYQPVKKDEIRMATFMNCEMNSIPNRFFELYSGVKVLDISYLKLQTFSSEPIEELLLLRNLNASFNNLTEVPSIPSLNSVSKLDLSGNPIVLNALSFKNLTWLSDLTLKNIGLYNLPEGIFLYQEDLQFVDLSNNFLTSIDMKELLPSFITLKTFQLDDNRISQLSELPGTLFMSLELLSLENNQFKCEYLTKFVNSNGLQAMRLSEKTEEKDIANLINNGFDVCQKEVIRATETNDYYEDDSN